MQNLLDKTDYSSFKVEKFMNIGVAFSIFKNTITATKTIASVNNKKAQPSCRALKCSLIFIRHKAGSSI